MPSVFLVADTHFGHAGVCRFLRDDGTKLRPWNDPNDMDEDMIKAWNDRVRPNDKVYHLGDAVINRRCLSIFDRLNGDKVLIKGNHDIFKKEDYLKHFRDIRGYHVMNGMILSHIPIHPLSLGRFGTNIHGHLHSNRVTCVDMFSDQVSIDPRYYCVSVEHLPNYAPILFEDVIKRIINEGGSVGFKQGNGPTM